MRLEGKVALITGGALGVEDELVSKRVGLSLLEDSVIDTSDALESAKRARGTQKCHVRRGKDNEVTLLNRPTIVRSTMFM